MEKNAANISVAECPDCGEKIRFKGVTKVGQQIMCPGCDAELEVVATDPIELDWAYDESDDDWDDDEEEDES